jgi:hypothetical protein
MQLEPNQTLLITVLTDVLNYKQLMYGGMWAAAQKNWCVLSSVFRRRDGV